MRISVDVDGVLAEQVVPILDRIRVKYGVTMRKEEIRSWNEPIPAANSNIEVEIEEALRNPAFILAMPVIEGAMDGLAALRAQGHEVVVVTNRVKDVDGTTQEWLVRQRACYHRYVNVSSQGKAAVTADLLVDDRPENVVEFVRSKRRAILFVQPWNEDFASTWAHGRGPIYPARGWQEVVNRVRELQGREPRGAQITENRPA